MRLAAPRPWTAPLYPGAVTHYGGSSPSLLFQAEYPTVGGGPSLYPCQLDTGITLAVLPSPFVESWQVALDDFEGWPDHVAVPDWCGIPCTIGVVGLRVPVLELPVPVELPAWVRVPMSYEEWMPKHLLIGTHFLVCHRAEVHLRLGHPLGYDPPFYQRCGELLLI